MTRLYLATFLVLSLISVSHAANFFGSCKYIQNATSARLLSELSVWKTVADKVHIPSSNIALPLIQCLKDKGAHELDTTFKAMTAEFPDGLEMYSNFKHAVEQFVEEANSINFNEGVSLDKRGLNRNKFVEVVLLEVEKAVQSLMNEFTLSLPESREKWLKNVDDSVSKILADLEVGLVTVLNPLGVQETVVREALDRIKPHIKNIVHVAGMPTPGFFPPSI